MRLISLTTVISLIFGTSNAAEVECDVRRVLDVPQLGFVSDTLVGMCIVNGVPYQTATTSNRSKNVNMFFGGLRILFSRHVAEGHPIDITYIIESSSVLQGKKLACEIFNKAVRCK